MKQNGGVVKSDQTGQILTKPQKSKKVLHLIRMNGKSIMLYLEIKVALTVTVMHKYYLEKKIEKNQISYPRNLISQVR